MEYFVAYVVIMIGVALVNLDDYEWEEFTVASVLFVLFLWVLAPIFFPIEMYRYIKD